MRQRIRIERKGDQFLLRLTPPQGSLIWECLGLALESPGGDVMLELHTGNTKQAVINVRDRVEHYSQNTSFDCIATAQQLHIIHSTIAYAALGFPSEEAFHIRIGFYRENAIGLANSISRSVRELALEPPETAL